MGEYHIVGHEPVTPEERKRLRELQAKSRKFFEYQKKLKRLIYVNVYSSGSRFLLL
jgi:hypothetical protein